MPKRAPVCLHVLISSYRMAVMHELLSD
jgi:hypothetical protein